MVVRPSGRYLVTGELSTGSSERKEKRIEPELMTGSPATTV